MHRVFIAVVIAAVIIIILLKFIDDQKKMSEVYPGLLISDWQSAINEELLKTKGITMIICLNKNYKTIKDDDVYQRLGITHHHFSIPDHPNAPIALIFSKTFDLIDAEIDRGGRVLVHCKAGISRASTIVVAYIIRKNNVRVDDALSHIRNTRAIVWPNFGFRNALDELDDHLRPV